MKRVLAIAGLLLIAACGKRGLLKPRDGRAPPPVPAAVRAAPTPEQMLVLPPQSQPLRADDPLSKSQERPDDRFDLPPPRR